MSLITLVLLVGVTELSTACTRVMEDSYGEASKFLCLLWVCLQFFSQWTIGPMDDWPNRRLAHLIFPNKFHLYANKMQHVYYGHNSPLLQAGR